MSMTNVKAMKLEELRARYPEMLKRGSVMELARGLGIKTWTVRTLMDGRDATLQPLPMKTKVRKGKKRKPPHRYYARETVFEVLGLV